MHCRLHDIVCECTFYFVHFIFVWRSRKIVNFQTYILILTFCSLNTFTTLWIRWPLHEWQESLPFHSSSSLWREKLFIHKKRTCVCGQIMSQTIFRVDETRQLAYWDFRQKNRFEQIYTFWSNKMRIPFEKKVLKSVHIQRGIIQIEKPTMISFDSL